MARTRDPVKLAASQTRLAARRLQWPLVAAGASARPLQVMRRLAHEHRLNLPIAVRCLYLLYALIKPERV